MQNWQWTSFLEEDLGQIRNFYLLVSIRLVIVYDLELEAINVHFARMAELVDAVDSKSTARKGVRVRLSLRAP